MQHDAAFCVPDTFWFETKMARKAKTTAYMAASSQADYNMHMPNANHWLIINGADHWTVHKKVVF